MTDPVNGSVDDPPPDGAEDGGTLEAHSRRGLLNLVIMLWLAGSLSDTRTIRLLYGLQGYGLFGFGGHPPSEYRDEDAESS